MTMKIRTEFVPGFEGLQSGDPDRVSRADFFEKTPASHVEKGNLQISFFVYKVTGKS